MVLESVVLLAEVSSEPVVFLVVSVESEEFLVVSVVLAAGVVESVLLLELVDDEVSFVPAAGVVSVLPELELEESSVLDGVDEELLPEVSDELEAGVELLSSAVLFAEAPLVSVESVDGDAVEALVSSAYFVELAEVVLLEASSSAK